MTGLSIPREIKERIIFESDLDEMIDWKRPMDPGEVRDCLKATEQIVQGILTPEEYDYQSEDPDVMGCLKGICFQMNGTQGNFVDYEEYARLFHPYLFRRLQSVDDNDEDDDEDDGFSDETREDIYDEIQEEYERDVWGITYQLDETWILGPMARDIFWRILVRLGYDRDIDPDSIAGLTKWGFLNGFTSFLFESWIPEMLLSAIQEREDNYQRLKKALEDMYGADVVVPDLESILRNKPGVVLVLRGTLARRLLDFSRLLECSLPPKSKILEMLTDPAWLAKFPSVQSYLETETLIG
eukprot:jgi/Picre1/34202/NNA_001676.t1